MFRAQEMSPLRRGRRHRRGPHRLRLDPSKTAPNVHEVCELVYSKATSHPARWVLCVPEESAIKSPEELAGGVIATELVGITRNYFDQGVPVKKVEFSWGATEVKARLARRHRRRHRDRLLHQGQQPPHHRHPPHQHHPPHRQQKSLDRPTAKREKIENIALLLKGAIDAREKVGLKMNVPRPS